MLAPEDLPIQPGGLIPEAVNWEGFSLNYNGVEVLQFSEFDLGFEAEYAFNTGKGGEIVSYSVKKYNRNCKTTVNIEELKSLIQLAVAYGGDLTKLPGLVVIAKADVGNGVLQMIIPAVRIMKYNINFKKDSDKTETALDLAVISVPVVTWA